MFIWTENWISHVSGRDQMLEQLSPAAHPQVQTRMNSTRTWTQALKQRAVQHPKWGPKPTPNTCLIYKPQVQWAWLVGAMPSKSRRPRKRGGTLGGSRGQECQSGQRWHYEGDGEWLKLCRQLWHVWFIFLNNDSDYCRYTEATRLSDGWAMNFTHQRYGMWSNLCNLASEPTFVLFCFFSKRPRTSAALHILHKLTANHSPKVWKSWAGQSSGWS